MDENDEKRYIRVHGDFNGLFGDILCLSHRDTCMDENGNEIVLSPGMLVTAFEPDTDEAGNPDELFASGTVEPASESLRCLGSRWVLRIDQNGVMHDSDLQEM